jgi:hypothetical protein
VAENTIGYTRKQAVNEWFDEECEVVNEEKNDLKAINTQRHTRTAYNNYNRLARERGTCLEGRKGNSRRRLQLKSSDIDQFRIRGNSTSD